MVRQLWEQSTHPKSTSSNKTVCANGESYCKSYTIGAATIVKTQLR